jgi:hypothetical protein
VDEVRIGRDEVLFYGWPDGRRRHTRQALRVKPDERVDIQPAPAVVAEVLRSAFPEAEPAGLMLMIPIEGDYTLVLGLPQPMAPQHELPYRHAPDDDVIDAEVVDDEGDAIVGADADEPLFMF